MNGEFDIKMEIKDNTVLDIKREALH